MSCGVYSLTEQMSVCSYSYIIFKCIMKRFNAFLFLDDVIIYLQAEFSVRTY